MMTFSMLFRLSVKMYDDQNRGYECFSTDLSLSCNIRIISNIEHELKLLWTFIYFVCSDKNISPLLEIGSPTTQYTYPYQQPQQQQNQSSSSVSNPAQYPYQQQPQSSQSFNAGQPSLSSLIIVTHVNSTGGSNNNTNPPPANFTQVVENAFTNPDGYTYIYHYMRGSETGITLSLQPGSFAVYELSNNNIKTNNPPLSQSTYDMTYSGDCRTVKSNVGGGTGYGHGIINPGETKTCTVTLSSHK
jgi:hypothetical protein